MICYSMDVGKALKQLIKKEGTTPRKLSVRLKINEGYLSLVLNNKIQPTCQWLEKILSPLGYSIEFIKKGRRKRKKSN